MMLWAEAGFWGMHNQNWRFAVEIEQLGGRQLVRVIDDGNVTMRSFDSLYDAETFAEEERVRLKVAKVVRR